MNKNGKEACLFGLPVHRAGDRGTVHNHFNVIITNFQEMIL